MEQKPDYNRMMRAELARVKPGARLLLHSCCGPCSSRCLEALKETFDVTVLFYNPNITEADENELRKREQIRLLRESGWADIAEEEYDPSVFYAAVRGREGEREGGSRCYLCYALRLDYTARFAKERGYEYFCTTLSVSPHKNARWINESGERFARQYGVAFLPSDFKKENGYLRSVELAKQYELYRQNYCGCEFSKWWILNAQTEKNE